MQSRMKMFISAIAIVSFVRMLQCVLVKRIRHTGDERHFFSPGKRAALGCVHCGLNATCSTN